MKSNQIRLHKLVLAHVRENNLEYNSPEIAKYIQEYGVLVDQELVNKRLYWTDKDSQIILNHWPAKKISDYSRLKILKKTKDYWIIYKPSGITVDLGSGHIKDNLLTYLRENYNLDFFLVHRLDKDTEGLMLIAIGQNNQLFLQNQFRSREVSKKYLALLKGKLEYKITITNWQYRDLKNPLKQKLFWKEVEATKYHPKARKSKSTFTPVFYNTEKNLTLAQVDIFTGRMHQIRLQAQELGLPILGDEVYKIHKNISLQKLEQKDCISLEYVDFSKTQTKISTDQILDLFRPQSFYLLSNYLEFRDWNNHKIITQIHKI